MHKNTFPTKEDIIRLSTFNALTGCWEWDGSLGSSNGYGQYMINYKNFLAHRLSCTAFYGEITDGLCVLHKCDNRTCVNPYHLFLGTKNHNNKDRASKNRSCVGISHPLHKLTEKDVIEIRRSSLGSRKIAKVYGVSPTLIKNIRNYRTWRHVI